MDGSTLVNKPLEPDFASSINFSSSALDPFFFKGPPGGEITALTTCFFVLAVVALLARSPCPSSSFNNTKQKQKNCQSRQKNEEEHCYYYYVFLVVTITIPISTSSRLANGFKKTIETKICSSSSSSLFSKRFFSYQSDVGKIAQKHDHLSTATTHILRYQRGLQISANTHSIVRLQRSSFILLALSLPSSALCRSAYLSEVLVGLCWQVEDFFLVFVAKSKLCFGKNEPVSMISNSKLDA